MASALQHDDDGNPTYAFKSSLVGGISQFKLKPDGLYWEVGRRGGNVRYERIKAVRLAYRPITMQSHRFTTEVWSANQPKLQIASVSWRSVVQQERLDAAYAAFIEELHRRIAAAGGTVQFISGIPAAAYWFGVVFFAAAVLATIVMAWRAVWVANWTSTAIIGIFLAVFAYQIANYFFRNRPGRYRPDAIPKNVLPAGKT